MKLNSMIIEHQSAKVEIFPKRHLPDFIRGEIRALLDKHTVQDLIPYEVALESLNLPERNSPGFLVRVMRRRLDMTQDVLAKKSKIAQGDISKIEHNKLKPGLRVAKKLAAVLKIDYKMLV